MNPFVLFRLFLESLIGLLALLKRAEKIEQDRQIEVKNDENEAGIKEAFKNEDSEALNQIFSGDSPDKLRDPKA